MEKSPDETPAKEGEWRSVFLLYRNLASITAAISVFLGISLVLTMKYDAAVINYMVLGFIIVLLLITLYLYSTGVRNRNWLYRWCRFRRSVDKVVEEIAKSLEEKDIETVKITAFPGFSINPWVPVLRLDMEKSSLKLEFSALMTGHMGSIAAMRRGLFLVMLQNRDAGNEKEAAEMTKIVDGLSS